MGLHHLFIKPCGLGQLFRVLAVLGFQLLGFLLFSSLFYIFSSLLGIFAIFIGILDIFGGKGGFLAFWKHLRPFGGFLVGFSGKYGRKIDK